MTSKRTVRLSLKILRKKFRAGMTVRKYRDKEVVFSQGDRADAVYYIQDGTVKLTAVSSRRKKAIIAFLQRGSFFGEGCLGGQSLRICTARSIGQSTIDRLSKVSMVGTLVRDARFAARFVEYLLSRISNRRRPSGPVLQFQRKAPGAGSVAAWACNPGIKAGLPSEGEPSELGGDGRHHPLKGK